MLEHFSFSYAGSSAAEDAPGPEESRGLKPASRNRKTKNALTAGFRQVFELNYAACVSRASLALKRNSGEDKVLGHQNVVVAKDVAEAGSVIDFFADDRHFDAGFTLE